MIVDDFKENACVSLDLKIGFNVDIMIFLIE